MNDKKIITKEFTEVKLNYDEPTPISKLREIFNEIEKDYPEYSDITADFYEYANDGDYDHGPPEAGIYFNGKRLETDEEYEKRLIQEKRIVEMKMKQEKENQERRKKDLEEFEKWERSEFERLMKKYGD